VQGAGLRPKTKDQRPKIKDQRSNIKQPTCAKAAVGKAKQQATRIQTEFDTRKQPQKGCFFLLTQ